jgi:hypothetical protein
MVPGFGASSLHGTSDSSGQAPFSPTESIKLLLKEKDDNNNYNIIQL